MRRLELFEVYLLIKIVEALYNFEEKYVNGKLQGKDTKLKHKLEKLLKGKKMRQKLKLC